MEGFLRSTLYDNNQCALRPIYICHLYMFSVTLLKNNIGNK